MPPMSLPPDSDMRVVSRGKSLLLLLLLPLLALLLTAVERARMGGRCCGAVMGSTGAGAPTVPSMPGELMRGLPPAPVFETRGLLPLLCVLGAAPPPLLGAAPDMLVRSGGGAGEPPAREVRSGARVATPPPGSVDILVQLNCCPEKLMPVALQDGAGAVFVAAVRLLSGGEGGGGETEVGTSARNLQAR